MMRYMHMLYITNSEKGLRVCLSGRSVFALGTWELRSGRPRKPLDWDGTKLVPSQMTSRFLIHIQI